jgi:hypothetical protein
MYCDSDCDCAVTVIVIMAVASISDIINYHYVGGGLTSQPSWETLSTLLTTFIRKKT